MRYPLSKYPIKIWSSLPMSLVSNHLQSAGVLLESYTLTDRTDLMADCDIWFGSLQNKSELLIKKTRWIQLDCTDLSNANGLQIEHLTHCGGIFSHLVAESILGSLLMIYRDLVSSIYAQKSQTWKRWAIRSNMGSMSQKNILILGGGNIAQNFIKLIRPFGCKVTVFRRQAISMDGAKVVTDVHRLDQMIPDADIVVNVLPKTSETNLFLNRKRLNSLAKETVLVSCGRSASLDEVALRNLLKESRIAAAVLDVTDEEPISKSNLLWKTPRLFLTQHTFGGHKQEQEIKCQFFAENLKRYLEGKPLQNEVKTLAV